MINASIATGMKIREAMRVSMIVFSIASSRFERREEKDMCSRAKVAALVLCAGLLMGNSCSSEQAATLRTTVGTLAEARTKLEAYGAILKQRYHATTPEFRAGETRYADAQAAFDGLVEGLVYCIAAGVKASDCELASSERRAVDTANHFVGYVNGLSQQQPRIAAAVVAPIVIDVATKVVDRMQSSSDQDRKRTVEMLNGLKVKPFKDL
jgi:hypothetical protein